MQDQCNNGLGGVARAVHEEFFSDGDFPGLRTAFAKELLSASMFIEEIDDALKEYDACVAKEMWGRIWRVMDDAVWSVEVAPAVKKLHDNRRKQAKKDAARVKACVAELSEITARWSNAAPGLLDVPDMQNDVQSLMVACEIIPKDPMRTFSEYGKGRLYPAFYSQKIDGQEWKGVLRHAVMGLEWNRIRFIFNGYDLVFKPTMSAWFDVVSAFRRAQSLGAIDSETVTKAVTEQRSYQRKITTYRGGLLVGLGGF